MLYSAARHGVLHTVFNVVYGVCVCVCLYLCVHVCLSEAILAQSSLAQSSLAQSILVQDAFARARPFATLARSCQPTSNVARRVPLWRSLVVCQTDRRFGDLLAGAGRSSVAIAAFLSRFVFRGQVPILCAPARYTGRAPNSSSSCCCSHVRRGDAKVADYGANVDMMLCLNQSMATQQSSVATQSSRMPQAPG